MNLEKTASEMGQIQAVIHAAGMSPHMATAEQLICTNAVETMGTALIILIEFKAQILYVTLKLFDFRISSVKRLFG